MLGEYKAIKFCFLLYPYILPGVSITCLFLWDFQDSFFNSQAFFDPLSKISILLPTTAASMGFHIQVKVQSRVVGYKHTNFDITLHNGPNARVKRKKMLIVIYISKVLMDFFHLYLEILNVNKRFGLCIDRFQFLFLRILGEFL